VTRPADWLAPGRRSRDSRRSALGEIEGNSQLQAIVRNYGAQQFTRRADLRSAATSLFGISAAVASAPGRRPRASIHLFPRRARAPVRWHFDTRTAAAALPGILEACHVPRTPDWLAPGRRPPGPQPPLGIPGAGACRVCDSQTRDCQTQPCFNVQATRIRRQIKLRHGRTMTPAARIASPISAPGQDAGGLAFSTPGPRPRSVQVDRRRAQASSSWTIAAPASRSCSWCSPTGPGPGRRAVGPRRPRRSCGRGSFALVDDRSAALQEQPKRSKPEA